MRNSKSGFSLIEILVSAFVLAFGVIGAIGMQLSALRTTQQSILQTQALHLAVDMADRMRASLPYMRMPEADNPYLRVDFQSGQQVSNAGLDCHAGCDPLQMARSDIAEWLLRLDRSLPDARVRICRDARQGTAGIGWNCEAGAGLAPVVIKIGWRDKDGTTAENAAPRLNLLVASFPP